MKKTILLGLLLQAVSALAAEKAVHVQTVMVDKPSFASGSNIICLGDWSRTNEKIALRLMRISEDHPALFSDLDEEKVNCFDVVAIPKTATKNLDEVLNMIDASASEKLFTTINPDGALVIDQKKQETFADILKEKHLTPLKRQNDAFGIKLLRAEALVLPLQGTVMGIFAALPSSISNWDAEKWRSLDKNFVRAWTTPPVLDKDAWYVNGVMHPISGATYYSALRSQGASRLQSFIFATVQSTIWEYVIESIVEQPSIQDLIMTPLIGSVLGELSHMLTMLMRRDGFTTLEKIAVTVINPAYVIMNGYKVGDK